MVELIHTHKGTVYAQRNGVLIPVNTNGLVGYWPMTQGSGLTVYDESKNGNAGTINGAVWTNTANEKALSFDGVDDTVDIPDSTILPSTRPLSALVWVRITSTEWTNMDVYAGIVNKRGTDYTTGRWEIGINKTSPVGEQLRFGVTDSAGNNTEMGVNESLINDGNWHFLCMTVDSNGNLEGFVDVISQGAITGALPEASGKPITIGRNEEDGMSWNGKIDEVRVYDRALSAQEITNIYEKTRGLYGI